MLRNILILVCTAAMLAFTTTGCKKSEPQEPQVKSMEEYQKEADEQITEENMDEELEKIEKELNAEEE